MTIGGILLDLSVGLSYSPVGNISAGKGFVNASIGIGAFVGVQYQYTPAAIPLK